MTHISPFKCSLLLKELFKNIIVTYLKIEKSVSCLTFFVLFVCFSFFLSFFLSFFSCEKVKVNVSHSLIAIGAVGVRVPLYLGHS